MKHSEINTAKKQKEKKPLTFDMPHNKKWGFACELENSFFFEKKPDLIELFLLLIKQKIELLLSFFVVYREIIRI
jgi:hypothetical protein